MGMGGGGGGAPNRLTDNLSVQGGEFLAVIGPVGCAR